MKPKNREDKLLRNIFDELEQLAFKPFTIKRKIIRYLVDECGMGITQIARKIGISKQAIADMLRKLPKSQKRPLTQKREAV